MWKSHQNSQEGFDEGTNEVTEVQRPYGCWHHRMIFRLSTSLCHLLWIRSDDTKLKHRTKKPICNGMPLHILALEVVINDVGQTFDSHLWDALLCSSKRPGYHVGCRLRWNRRIGIQHRVLNQDAIKWFQDNTEEWSKNIALKFVPLLCISWILTTVILNFGTRHLHLLVSEPGVV